jgi:two-component system response regulator LytT
VHHHPLAELEHRLHGRGFLRVHRAYLVNLRHVLTIESFFNGTYLLKLRNVPDLTVPVSRRHAADLRAAVHL